MRYFAYYLDQHSALLQLQKIRSFVLLYLSNILYKSTSGDHISGNHALLKYECGRAALPEDCLYKSQEIIGQVVSLTQAQTWMSLSHELMYCLKVRKKVISNETLCLLLKPV